MFFTLGTCVGAWAAALPVLKANLGLSDQGLSISLLALSVGSVLSSVAAGALVPRLGTGRATGVTALVVIFALLLPPLAGTLVQFVALAFALGVSFGALDVSVNGHAGDIEQRWGGPLMSSFHGAFSLGGLAGSSLGGLLAAAGWSACGQMWIPVGLAGLLNLAVLPGLGRGQRSKGGSLSLAWPERTVLGLCAVGFFAFLIEGAMADWSAVYLSSVTGSTVAVAATGYAAFSVTMAAGRFAGDSIVARVGQRRVVMVGAGLSALGVGLAVMVALPLVAAFGFALVGLGLSNVAPVVFSGAARSGSTPAAGVAAVATVGFGGFLSGPPLIGAIAVLAGLRVAMAALLVAAAIIALAGSTVGARRNR